MECHNMYPLYYKLIKNSTAETRARSEARETARHSPGDIQQSPLTPRRERARARLDQKKSRSGGKIEVLYVDTTRNVGVALGEKNVGANMKKPGKR